MQLDGIAAPMSISKKYALDFSVLPIRVSFVDEASRSCGGQDALGTFFHALDFGAPVEPLPESGAEATTPATDLVRKPYQPEPEPESATFPAGESGGAAANEVDSSKVLHAFFCHLCEPDTYEGSMKLDVDQQCFTWSWKVTGPQKDGEIVSQYSRSPGENI